MLETLPFKLEHSNICTLQLGGRINKEILYIYLLNLIIINKRMKIIIYSCILYNKYVEQYLDALKML